MTLSTNALGQYDAPRLAAALQRAQERIRQLEQENSALCNEIRWIDKLLAVPASIMSPSHKVTLRAAVKAYRQGTPDEDGLVQIESWKLCKTVGQSKQTFLDNLTYCTENLGILTKKRERLVDSDTNDYTTNLSIGVTPLLAHPHAYKVEQPRNHGGQRQLCPHCHSDRLQRTVTMTCMSCGSVLDEKRSLVNQGSHLDASQESQDDQGENGSVEVSIFNEFSGSSYAPLHNEEDISAATNVNLTAIKTNVLESQLDDSGIPQQEPATPPMGEVVNDGGVTAPYSQEASPDEQHQVQPALSTTETLSQTDLLAHAAQLLVEIAGPELVHIEMSPRGPKKYYEVKRAITMQDTRAHLGGWKTKGAYLRRPDGMTRAVCYDADTPQNWEHLLDAARFLAEAGYLPIVEDSPVGRGGHLWIIYTRLVSALSAHQHLLQVAPMLQHIKECWPGPGPNKVRLLGGKYVKPGFSQWCKLHDAHGVRIAEDGQNVARVLLTYQTPAEIVPASAEPEAVPQCASSLACHPVPTDTGPEPCGIPAGRAGEFAAVPDNDIGQRRGLDTDQQAHTCSAQNVTTCCEGMQPGIDQHWHEKYNRHLWFQFTPAQLAAWYNQRYDTDDLVAFDPHGMANAGVIGRPERTPSLGRTKDRQWFSDFGTSVRRADGKPDGGDVLELRARVNAQGCGASKPETMRELARQLVSEAREALESAAHRGEQPPHWVQAFMSSAGWDYYHQVRNQAGDPDEAALAIQEPAPHTGGAAGFYLPWQPIHRSTEPSDQDPCQLREAAQDAPPDRSRTHDTLEALAAELRIEPGEACGRCGCTLRYQSGPYLMCHKCHPRPLRSGGLSDEQWQRLQALFPRRG